MPIANEIHVADLDQLHRRQGLVPVARPGDAHPTFPARFLQRAKAAVKVVAAPFGAPDALDGHGLQAGIVLGK